MFDILAQLGELAPDMIRRRPNGPPAQMLMPSQMAIGEMMSGAQEAMSLHGGDSGATDSAASPMMAQTGGMKGALSGMASQIGQMDGGDEEIKHASFDLPGASSNGIRQQTISGLRGYARGGTLRAGDMGIVGEEDPEVIRARKGGGVDVIPIDSEADTQGYFQANPDAPMPDGVQQTVAAAQQGQPDARQLINPQDQAIADEYGKLDVERQKTTKSPWKDAGFGILQGLNNALNNRNDPIQGWNEFGEEKRMRPIKQRIGELEGQRKLGLDAEKDKVNIENARLKPEFERSKIKLREKELEAKTESQLRTYERLVEQEKNKSIREGNRSQVKEVDGYLVRFYPGDPTKEMEPIIDPRTGKQAFNPANVAQEITFEDGTKAMAKGGQIVAGKFAEGRQKSQQEFTAGQNDLTRQETQRQWNASFQLRIAEMTRQLGGDQQALAKWKMEQIREIEKDRAANKADKSKGLPPEIADAMINALNSNNAQPK